MRAHSRGFRNIPSVFLICITGLLCQAQSPTPVALPYTITTLAGGLVPTTYTAGTTLCPGSTTLKAMTTYGDGCPAVASNFGASGRGGVAVDSFGNAFVADDIYGVVHMIDPNTGIMSVAAGAGTVCSARLDSAGDGCLASVQTVLSHPRGIGMDPYGNVLIPEYGQNLIHIVCRYGSPLCTTGTPSPTVSNPIQIQIGYMGIAGGCSASTGSTGTSGIGYDGTPGFTTSSHAIPSFNNGGSCTPSRGEVGAPRAAWGDRFGNIYYADTNSSRTRVILGPLTSSYFNGNNPLYAALEVNTNWTSSNLMPGYVYTIANVSGYSTSTSTATVTTGSACLASITSPSGDGSITYRYSGNATALDIHADGCPFFDSSVTASSGFTDTVVTDAAGNLIFTDPGSTGFLRVFFVQGWSSSVAAASAGATGPVATAGVSMYNAIVKNNSAVTPMPGYIYALAGGGATSLSAAPTQGTNTSITDSTITKVAISPQGNIYIGDYNRVLFYDIDNGTIRVLLSSGTSPAAVGSYCNGSSGAIAKSSYGDGCPASALGSYAGFGNNNGLSVAVDAQGNLYMYDSSSYAGGMLVRKVLAQGLGVQSNTTLAALATAKSAYPLQALGTTQTQTLMAHFPSADAASATLTNTANPAVSYGSPNCTWYSSVDNSVDCTVAISYAPTAVGLQSAAMTLAASGGEQLTLNLANTVTGSVLAVDNASSAGAAILKTASVMSGHTPTAIAVDGAGNVYEASGTSIFESLAGSPSSTIVLASGLPVAPTKLAVDAAGNIYYLNGSSTVQVLAVSTAGSPSHYSPSTLEYTPWNLGTANPVNIAVDSAGNVLVADEQNSSGTIYRISPTCANIVSSSVLTSSCQTTVSSAGGGFGVVNALTVDPSGNIYVADSTNNVYKLTPGVDETSADSTYGQFVYTQSTALSGVAEALAVDAAGDLYVQNASGTAGVTEYPLSGPTSAGVKVFGSITTPGGIAVDGSGNLYSADAGTTFVTEVQRNAITENFGSSQTAEFIATLTNLGNQTSTEQTATASTGAQASDFTLAGTSSYGCTFSNNLLTAMNSGQACGLTAYFPALGNTQQTDYIAFAPTPPATVTSGVLTLTGLADTKAFATTTSIGAATPSSPVFVASGTEVSLPVTVTASSSSTDGTVTNNTSGPTISNFVSISVDSGAATNRYFTSANGLTASLTLNLSGLKAGGHSFTVNFPQQGQLVGSSASGSFTVAQEVTTITWSPASTTQQVSAPIGTSVLNATISPNISGNFVYSTTSSPSCAGTSGGTIDASTYLPIGSYALYTTFCPIDSTDYAVSSATVSSYTVTKASTMASVGASTNVVAADGTGNYTTLSAALVALPVAGGTIYIKPGTYTGQNVISYPNVALRGLGGDPTKVILTGEDGAFSSPYIGYLGTGTGSGNASAGGDQGSATLDVTRSYYMGETSGSTANPIGLTNTTQSIPNNFYAENLTIQNTWDMDPKTTTTYYYNGSGCVAGGSTITLQAAYNTGKSCNSQAIALWITADQAVLNNVNLASQQDTLYAGSQGCGTYCWTARQYMWKGTISGDVDYVFGDAAAVFDHTNFFTTWHGTSPGGTTTIEAQSKYRQTGSPNDYLSGYVCNGCTFMSQSTGMGELFYGRPWGPYSTWIQLNNYVDQVNPVGWIEFSGTNNLPTSTYGEYNTMPYADPAVGTSPYPSSINYVTPTGGNTGSGATSVSSRETTSTNPGTMQAGNAISTQLTAAQAVQYYPINFLSANLSPGTISPGSSATWNPVSALTAWVNSFAPKASVGSLTYGSSVTILGRPQTVGAGVIPTGSYTFYDTLNTNQACTASSSGCTTLASGTLDASGEAYLTTSSLASGTHYITMVYGGDSSFSGSTSAVYTIQVLKPGQSATTTSLAVANTSSTTGTVISGTVTVEPSAATGTAQVYLDNVVATTCTLSSGSCAWSIPGPSIGAHTLYAYYEGNTSYGDSTSSASTLEVVAPAATGDARAVTEPTLPSACQRLTATLSTDPSIQDLDANVDANNSNIDGARIQAALYACSGAGQAVELSTDSTGSYNAFLSGPLTMPSNGTLIVDPGVTLYFSRNVQDYDKVSGTHTCGTINNNSATSSCLPLIDIPKNSTNVGIMGYGKLNGRGGDVLLNTFTTSGFAMPSTPTWWNLAAQANGEGGQQNPRFIQIEGGASNITLYKITIMNSPMFHVSTTGAISGLTAWDVKIVTPTSSRNTDGIDPGAVQNATIAYSWISDGDDNIAAAGHNGIGQNMSIINNHFFAGHGESIGSLTDSNVSNILFDHNMLAGNAFPQHGSSQWGLTADGNSTAIRIKTSSDRGGMVSNIQYSNSCFLDHKTDIQFTPYYNSTDGTKYPNYNNILLQNLVFLNDANSAGRVELDGYFNSNGDISGGSAVTYPLGITMDNVIFPSVLSSLVASTTPVESTSVWNYGGYSGGTGQYVSLTAGPGQVSSNFLTLYNALVANPANHDTLTNNITQSSLDPSACAFTYLAPELTGPTGVPQSISYGNPAAIDVILTPAVGGAPYPTGTVTLTDTTTNNTYTATLPGNSDTAMATIPAADLTVGTHTFTATYLGDSNYIIPSSYQTFGSYQVTVAAAPQTINFVPSTTTYTYSPSGTFTVNASASSGLPVSFASTTSSVCSVSGSTVTILSGGTCTIEATQAGNSNYQAATAVSVNFTISPATPTVTAWPSASSITYGQSLSLSTLSGGMASVPGTFAWTAPSTTPQAGRQSESVTFTPINTTDYTTLTGTVSVMVTKATPTVTAWPTPSMIHYEQPLSSSTLTGGAATGVGGASLAGSFAWTVPSTVPDKPGMRPERVTFTPTDTTDYNTVTGTVIVKVMKGHDYGARRN